MLTYLYEQQNIGNICHNRVINGRIVRKYPSDTKCTGRQPSKVLRSGSLRQSFLK